MKLNSQVAVLERRPHPQKDQWLKGVLLGRREVNHETIYNVGVGEHSSYREKEYHSNDVKRYEPLDEAVAAEQHAAELIDLFPMVRDALTELLPDEKIEIKEGSIVGYYGTVTLDPVVYERHTIGALKEYGGWQVTVWKRYPATRHQPEDISDAPVGEPAHYNLVMQKFIQTIFALKADDYWQHQADMKLDLMEYGALPPEM